MNLLEKKETLEKQRVNIENSFHKIVGAMEMIDALIEEEKLEKKKEKDDAKKKTSKK
jgi:hypothetical protein